MGTKNNPKNRGAAANQKMIDGKIVKPVKYMGRSLGHGNFVAGQYDNGQLIVDSEGVPVPFVEIRGDAEAA